MPAPLLVAAAPYIASGLGFLGGLFNNRARTQRQTSQYSNTQSSTLSPEATGVNDILLQQIRQRLSAPSALPEGYREGGIREINSVFDVINQSKNANLTARGLSDSPVAAIGTDNARGGEIARFSSGLPLIERGLRDQDTEAAMRAIALQPRTTTSSGTSSGTSTMPGNMLGGGLQDMSSMLAFLYGSGAFGGGGGGFTSGGRGGPFDRR